MRLMVVIVGFAKYDTYKSRYVGFLMILNAIFPRHFGFITSRLRSGGESNQIWFGLCKSGLVLKEM